MYGSFLMGETERGKLGLFLVDKAMLSKSLIQFSVDGGICVPTQEADPDLPVSLQEFPAEAWVGVGWWWPAVGLLPWWLRG